MRQVEAILLVNHQIPAKEKFEDRPISPASFSFSKIFYWNFWFSKDASKPQYSWALASLRCATHAYLENRKIIKNTPKSPILLSVSPLHANVDAEGTHVQSP
jgi:hypothetical protein